MRTRRCLRFTRLKLTSHLSAALLAGLALLLGAGVAAAHISITPADALPGTNVTFSVRVPTEQESPTVRVRIEFPAGVTVSRFQPKPGWQRTVERDGSGRITSATWSGGQIQNGEFEDFVFIARTPADAGALRFRAFQTYGAGETVEWINEAGPRPAPVVNVRAAAASSAAVDDHGQAVSPATPGAAGAAPAATGAATGSSGASTARPTVSASSAPGTAESVQAGSGSDLPLFVALGSGAIALVSLALAVVALVRRPADPAVTASGRAG